MKFFFLFLLFSDTTDTDLIGRVVLYDAWSDMLLIRSSVEHDSLVADFRREVGHVAG